MWQEHFKTKEEALKHLFECLVLNPGCAGKDGFITITMGKELIQIKPLKKKKNEEE